MWGAHGESTDCSLIRCFGWMVGDRSLEKEKGERRSEGVLESGCGQIVIPLAPCFCAAEFYYAPTAAWATVRLFARNLC